MEEEKEENILLYRTVGYSVAILTVFGMIAMFAFFINYQYRGVGTVYCEFPYIGDLKFDDPFTINGMEIGYVKGIYANEPNRAIVKINLNSPIEVREGFKLFIGDVGIMGERVVCLENGCQDAPIVNLRDTLVGIYYPGISDMLGRMMELRDFLDECIAFVDKLRFGTDSSRSIIEWINNAETAIDKFSLSLQNTAVSWEKDIPDALEKIDDLSENLNKGLTEFGEKLPDIIEKLDVVIDDCDTLLTKISEIENIANDAKKLVESIDTLNIASINETMVDLQTEIEKVYNSALKLRLLLVKDRQKK